MRPRLLLTVGGLLALWGLVSLLPLLRAWVLPVEVTVQVRPVLRPARQGAAASAPGSTPRAGPGPWRRVRAEVTQTSPVDAFALGDAVQFDRYGTVPGARGSVQCVWRAPGAPPVHVTSLGGGQHYAAHVRLDADPDPATCPE